MTTPEAPYDTTTPVITQATTSTNNPTPPTASSFFPPVNATSHTAMPRSTNIPSTQNQPSTVNNTQRYTSTPPMIGTTYVQSYLSYTTPAFQSHHDPIQMDMNHQLASFQQSILEQNQRQMQLMQQQFQMTLESSLQAITDTVARSLSTVPVYHHQPTVRSFRDPSPTAPPPEISCTHANPPKDDLSDYQSATSSIPNMTKSVTSNHTQQELPEPTSNTPSSQQEMIDFLTAIKEPKLSFNTLKQNTDFIAWKAMMALKCAKSTKHSKLAKLGENGSYVFDESMSADDSSTLFMLVYNALGQISEKIVVDVTSPNGFTLLKQLEDYFVDVDTSVVNRQILLQEFDSLKRNSNESYHAFALRFLRKCKELELNQVVIPTDEASTAYKFLRGLNEKRINTKIYLELASKPSWYKSLSLIDIAKKAQRYMKQYNALSNLPTKNAPNGNGNSNSQPKQEKEKPNNKLPKDPPPPSVTDTTDNKSSHEDKVKTMEQYLANANDVEAYLRGIKRKDKEKFGAKATKNACTNLEIFDVWTKVNAEDVQPRPANAAARRMKSDQQNDTSTLGDTFAQALKTALSEHSEQMISKFKDMNMNATDNTTNNNSDNSSNEPSNPYSNVLLTNDTAASFQPPSIDLPPPPDPLQHNP